MSHTIRIRGLFTLAVAIVGLLFLTLNHSVSFSSSTPTAMPSPTETCPPIVHKVTITMSDDVIAVGDTFTVTVESSGFAGLADVRLINSYRLASIPDLEIMESGPMVEVLPTSRGSDTGYGTFDLRALRSGPLVLSAEIYGDAFFYSGDTCFAATHFMTVQSESLNLFIAP
ncbi:MAG TPA: hypothetical protein VHP83_01230 [Aggregatilineaceae bacterium]|nr:hypothetical protein [Aggregatilineaceae bacterium]